MSEPHPAIASEAPTLPGTAVLQLEAEYHYDVWGNRTQKIVDADGAGANDAVATRYAYDGWNPGKPSPRGTENFYLWATFDDESSLTSREIQGEGFDEHLARIADSNAYFYLEDHLNSIRAVLDGTGAPVDEIEYDAFGNITSESSPGNRGLYAYTGREFDVETQLQYNRARYYDATPGRWISQDPLGFDAGDSNLYRYAFNRPSDYADPSGNDVLIIGLEGFLGRNPSNPRQRGPIIFQNQLWQNFLEPFEGQGGVHIQYYDQSNADLFFLSRFANARADDIRTPRGYLVDGKIVTSISSALMSKPSDSNIGITLTLPKLTPGKAVYDRVAVVGWSWGGEGAIRLVESLNRRGIKVDLLFTIDPVSAPIHNISNRALTPLALFQTGARASEFWNYFQRTDLFSGALTPIRGMSVQNAVNIELKRPDFFPQNAASFGHMTITENPTVIKQWRRLINELREKPYRFREEAFSN